MSGMAIGLTIFACLMFLLVFRIHVGIGMLFAGSAAFLAMNHGDFNALLFTLNNLAYARLSNYDLAVIPLFMLMGQFATNGGLSKALFRCAAAFIGHFRGGLAMAATGACAGFGAICGSSLATAATMGQVALSELRAHGYSGRLATGTLAAGRQVVDDLGALQRQAVEIDHVDVGLVARRQQAAVVEAVGLGRAACLLGDQELERELGAAPAVARPQGEQ